MPHADPTSTITAVIEAVAAMVPAYLENPQDRQIADGNLAILVIDEDGRMWGRMFGTDRMRQREICHTAWKKATQVWLTGFPTGTYEELVYSKQVQWWTYGLPLPELIGWHGGVPAVLADGSKVALAFSGLRGEQDVEILHRAVAQVPGIAVPLPAA